YILLFYSLSINEAVYFLSFPTRRSSDLLHYLGRTKEMLKVNGMSVFPSELEHLFSRHPHVAACGVIGVADPKKGQVPVAYIQLEDRKSTRLNSSHVSISYAVLCLKKKIQ